ncbi:MAG: hypothetical protein R3284_08540, partial [Rubricoccaceae bacterium]|nr:hypothetical protein [Rubricoccaceae bacterium]
WTLGALLLFLCFIAPFTIGTGTERSTVRESQADTPAQTAPPGAPADPGAGTLPPGTGDAPATGGEAASPEPATE